MPAHTPLHCLPPTTLHNESKGVCQCSNLRVGTYWSSHLKKRAHAERCHLQAGMALVALIHTTPLQGPFPQCCAIKRGGELRETGRETAACCCAGTNAAGWICVHASICGMKGVEAVAAHAVAKMVCPQEAPGTNPSTVS